MQRPRSPGLRRLALATLIAFTCAGVALVVWSPWRERGADAAFDTSVQRPALLGRRPKVLFDHGHNNSHSITGRFAPFARLLRADGCEVASVSSAITPAVLSGRDVLVIVNPRGPGNRHELPAFTDSEIRAIAEWVSAGGSLLLAADHHPCGAAAGGLARAFSVEMVDGWYEDESNAFPGTADSGAIAFRRENGALGDHPIIHGRGDGEAVQTVVTFTGQSLMPPEAAAVLLACAASGVDRVPVSSESVTTGGRTVTTFETEDTSAAGHCQGLAMSFGAGRVVVLGEASMLSAQIDAESGLRFGMNVDGTGNRQFVLSTVRWLARELN